MLPSLAFCSILEGGVSTKVTVVAVHQTVIKTHTQLSTRFNSLQSRSRTSCITMSILGAGLSAGCAEGQPRTVPCRGPPLVIVAQFPQASEKRSPRRPSFLPSHTGAHFNPSRNRQARTPSSREHTTGTCCFARQAIPVWVARESVPVQLFIAPESRLHDRSTEPQHRLAPRDRSPGPGIGISRFLQRRRTSLSAFGIPHPETRSYHPLASVHAAL
jgi:hypothetical protein